MAEETVKNILVIGPSWVGDMVMSQALFMCLKKKESRFSDHRHGTKLDAAFIRSHA
ncbi:MAG: hypothetical protein CM1200mP40_15640 [Gammaproteobacteria bacterium]|nr:MAG: hypothetical protein CM1200mP40_15640 [Gammaproteobacteria bacterium]